MPPFVPRGKAPGNIFVRPRPGQCFNGFMLGRPNILLTIADDHRATALGGAGIEPVQTPALDALAARGTRFARAQHLGSCHGAVCAPSRAMLHTAVPYFQLDEALLGATYPPADHPMPPLLGAKLRQAGYDCFATGKWHNGTPGFQASFDDARNIFFGGMADHWFTPVQDYDPTGQYPKTRRREAKGFSTEVFAASAIDFLRSRRNNPEPFFCYCAFTAPHDPRTPPDAWRRRYPPAKMPSFPNMDAAHFGHSPSAVSPVRDMGTSLDRDELLLGTPRDVSELRRALAGYYGMISHMDEWIGRIHGALDDNGLAENTIVIHTSDHGLAVGQHGFLGKENLYQHSVNVPLILAGPDIPRGVVSDALCYQHDLHPTLAARAGVAAPEGSPFLNLDAQLAGSATRTHLASSYRDTMRSIRDDRWKLIEYHVDGTRSCELFDLRDDPWETTNLADRSEARSILDSHRTALATWQREVGDNAWKPDTAP